MWEKIIQDFVASRRKERMLFLAHSKKRQGDLYHELLHVPIGFANECIVEIPSNEQQVDAVFERMRKMGVGETCWVYSYINDIDQNVVPFRVAIESVLGQCIETILYFEKPGIAYYEGGHCDRLILKRRSQDQR